MHAGSPKPGARSTGKRNGSNPSGPNPPAPLVDRHVERSADSGDHAVEVGIDRIARMATRLGLGATLGIELPGEKAGLIPTKEWKRAVTGVPWQQGETLVAAIGQGFVLTTPLQLAVMTARLANGGRAVKPRLGRRVENPHGGEGAPPPHRPRPPPPDHLHQVVD